MLKDILKSMREERNLTQKELSKILKVSQQTIGSWETGRTEPNNATLKKIAEFFNVSVDYILGRCTISEVSINDNDNSNTLTALDLELEDIINNIKQKDDSTKEAFIKLLNNTLSLAESLNKTDTDSK